MDKKIFIIKQRNIQFNCGRFHLGQEATYRQHVVYGILHALHTYECRVTWVVGRIWAVESLSLNRKYILTQACYKWMLHPGDICCDYLMVIITKIIGTRYTLDIRESVDGNN